MKKFNHISTFLVFNLLFIIFNSNAQNNSWKPLKTGAGGWATGLNIHPSGNPVFCRIDVGSAYRYDATNQTWTNIVTSNNIPTSDIDWLKYGGVLSLVSAPSNNTIAYLAYFDGIYKSNNKGDTWIKTNFPSTPMPSNQDSSKYSGERLSVDPINPNVVYFGSVNNGLWKTIDAGSSWSQITTIPNGTSNHGVRQIQFDSSSGTTTGKTNIIYTTVDGEGVYKSSDTGINWAKISTNEFGTNEINFLDSNVDATGKLYVTGFSKVVQPNGEIYEVGFGIYRYNGSTWQQILSNPTASVFNIAIDPFNNNNIFGFSYGGGTIYKTSNANVTNPTWTNPSYTRTNGSIGWFGYSDSYYFTIGEAEFDPIVPNKLWISEGVGVWNCTNLNDANLTWVENSSGQEHLVSNDLVVNASGKAVTSHWDRGIFHHENNDVYPSTQKPSARFNSAWDMDVCASNKNFIVAIIEDHRYCCYDNEHRNSGYSQDGGLNWTKFPTQADNANVNSIFGNIAVSANDVNNIVWLPSSNTNPYYTTNKGGSWTQVTLPNNQGSCCHVANYLSKNVLVADQVVSNTFYIHNWQNGSIYKTTNGGASWTENTSLSDFYGYHAKMKATPNFAGHLWFTHAFENTISNMQPLKRSINGGDSWTNIANTSEVINFALGKPATGSNYPTLFIQGKVNGVFGFWMSTNQGISWTSLGQYPLGIYDVSKVMEGDFNVFGRVYVGYGGNGFVYSDASSLGTGDNLFEEKPELKIYPNPSKNEINIIANDYNQPISILDITGKLIIEFNQIPNKLDISKLQTGFYFVKTKNQSYKFIKE